MDKAKYLITIDKRTDEGLVGYKNLPANDFKNAMDIFTKITKNFPPQEFTICLYEIGENGKLGQKLACNYLCELKEKEETINV